MTIRTYEQTGVEQDGGTDAVDRWGYGDNVARGSAAMGLFLGTMRRYGLPLIELKPVPDPNAAHHDGRTPANTGGQPPRDAVAAWILRPFQHGSDDTAPEPGYAATPSGALYAFDSQLQPSAAPIDLAALDGGVVSGWVAIALQAAHGHSGGYYPWALSETTEVVPAGQAFVGTPTIMGPGTMAA